jgi:MYXO-CTERM domain-containing protein
MTGSSCRRTVLAVVLLLLAIVAIVSPSVVLAQAPAGPTVQAPPAGPTVQTPPATRTETRADDDSGKWGLLGLLGLVGLAGLLRRDKARSVTVADRPDRR